jgi:DNA invertase Pin-like site-specific DNA recombinase
MKAALYARVSTTNGDQNPEVQLDELRAWAQRLGYEVTAAYVDRLSGTKGADERPALTEALSAAHRREYDCLLVWALDRVSRGGIGATAAIIERLRRDGVRLKSYREEWLDTATPGVAELLTAILSWVAAQERERIRERVRAGLVRAKRHGTRSGRAIGRPGIVLDLARAKKALAKAGSLRAAAKLLQCSDRTLRRRLSIIGGRPGSS